MSYRFPGWVANLDYGYILPVIAKMPLWLARPCWILRGLVNFVFDWDWRTFALGHGYVRRATFRSMCTLSHLTSGQPHPLFLTASRFINMSREEVDCLRLSAIDYSLVKHRITGLDYLKEAQRSGVGVVLITAHFDSLYIGLVLLARAGLVVNLMSTRITDDPSVPSRISRHFKTKISSLNYLLSPGKVRHSEDHMRFFVKALNRGEIVLIAGDGPSTASGRSAPVDFLGKRRFMAAGPQFLAESTDSLISGYSCRLASDRHFEITISQPSLAADGGLQATYSALEEELLRHPSSWWSADLMQAYGHEPSASNGN